MRDERAAEPLAVVIGGRLCAAWFARDPSLVGRAVKVGTAAATVVGVMPERFGLRWPLEQDLARELSCHVAERADDRAVVHVRGMFVTSRSVGVLNVPGSASNTDPFVTAWRPSSANRLVAGSHRYPGLWNCPSVNSGGR